MIKTVEDLKALPPYQPISAYLPNGVLILAYRSPNGLWWSSWKLKTTDPEELAEFVSWQQDADWEGWVLLVPKTDESC